LPLLVLALFVFAVILSAAKDPDTAQPATTAHPFLPGNPIRSTTAVMPASTHFSPRYLTLLLFLTLVPTTTHAQTAAITGPQPAASLPPQLYGKWRIQRIIPARTISCWGNREAQKVLGTEIEYSQAVFRWKTYSVSNPLATSQTFTASEFRQEYSGGGAADSYVDFQELGIHTPAITMLSIPHVDANFTGATSEIPGDTVLLVSKDRIIITVCNLYFEAVLIGNKKPVH
jgi:hypothetical protein